MAIAYTCRVPKPQKRLQRIVVDKNMFGNQGFHEIKFYLEGSKQNFLIITDLLVRECMQGNAADNFVSDFSRMVPYAEQLIALKTTYLISKLKARREGLQQRLICSSQTSDLRKGLANTISNIRERGTTQKFNTFASRSQSLFNELLNKNPEMRLMLDDLIKTFPKNELAKIRAGQAVSRQFADHLLAKLAEFAISMFPEGVALPKMPDVLYSFPYRYSIAYLNLAFDWRLNDGGIKNAKPEQIRNDSIDLTYVTYGTFFDGLFSCDKRVLRVFRQTADWIESLVSAFNRS